MERLHWCLQIGHMCLATCSGGVADSVTVVECIHAMLPAITSHKPRQANLHLRPVGQRHGCMDKNCCGTRTSTLTITLTTKGDNKSASPSISYQSCLACLQGSVYMSALCTALSHLHHTLHAGGLVDTLLGKWACHRSLPTRMQALEAWQRGTVSAWVPIDVNRMRLYASALHGATYMQSTLCHMAHSVCICHGPHTPGRQHNWIGLQLDSRQAMFANISEMQARVHMHHAVQGRGRMRCRLSV